MNPPAPSRKIRILVVDDHRVVRVGVRTLLAQEPDMEVVAEAEDGPGTLAAYEAHRPDVTLMDLRLPDVAGHELIAQIRKRDPQAKIIVLTSYGADEDVFRAVQAGARGYLLKGELPDETLEVAIRAVFSGKRHLPRELADRLADRLGAQALTPREVAVLELVAKGLSNTEIGVALSVTAGTVKTHLARIYPKLGVTDRTVAALVAVQRGIVNLD